MYSVPGHLLFKYKTYKRCPGQRILPFIFPREIKNQAAENASKDSKQHEPLDTSFTDTKTAFKSKYTSELVRGHIVYTICLSKFLVDNNMKIMNKMKNVLGQKLFEKIMRATFYGQFVAGADESEFSPIVERLLAFGVLSILDYSVEEDLTSEEATKLEVAAETPEVHDPAFDKDKLEMGGEMSQFKTDERFADRRRDVNSARTFFYLDEPSSEKTFEVFLDTIITSASNSPPGKGIAAIKVTGLGKPQLLLQLSEAIMRSRVFVKQIMGLEGGNENVISHHIPIEDLSKKIKAAGVEDVDHFLKNIETDSSGVIHLFPWTGIIDDNFELNDTFMLPSLSKRKMVPLIERLSPKDESSFRNMIRRLRLLAETAKQLKVVMMVDAEQTYLQPAIQRITMELMHRFNTEGVVVYNTYQMYLKQTLRELSNDLEQARRGNFFWGAKLVRGAYMVQERERAVEMAYEDPIHSNYNATSESYFAGMFEVLRHMKEQMDDKMEVKFKVMFATHNEETIRMAVQMMQNMGIAPDRGLVQFGQLYGMCDHLTFPLGNSGYQVYKYLPYGPVNEVLPYISRRASENKGFLTNMKKDQKMLMKEIARRTLSGQIFYKPKP